MHPHRPPLTRIRSPQHRHISRKRPHRRQRKSSRCIVCCIIRGRLSPVPGLSRVAGPRSRLHALSLKSQSRTSEPKTSRPSLGPKRRPSSSHPPNPFALRAVVAGGRLARRNRAARGRKPGRSGRACPAKAVGPLPSISQGQPCPPAKSALAAERFALCVWLLCRVCVLNTADDLAVGGRVTVAMRQESRYSAE